MNLKIDFIIKRLKAHGYQSYLVGGAVRDLVLKRKSDDMDILTEASISEVESVFSDQNLKTVGKSFPHCIVNGVDVSSSRARSGHEDFPESDLVRRDFTINAMAFDLATKTIIDPFNGQKDIEDRMIRFTQEPLKRIEEDPVRMVRACRFLALLQGSFPISTLTAIHHLKDLLKSHVARERIGNEIIKAMALEKPSFFFSALQKTGLLFHIFPSLDRCAGLDGGPHHRESVFEHCLLVGDSLPQTQPLMRLAGFLHDTGKFDAKVMGNGELSFAGHENFFDAAVKDLSSLKFSEKDIHYIKALILTHMRPLTPETTPRAARRLLAMLAEQGLSYQEFMRMRIADKKGNMAKRPYTLSEIRIRLKKLLDEIHPSSVLTMNQLNIDGHEIASLMDISPSPRLGEIKRQLFEKVLDNPELNQKEELIKLCLSLKTKM